MSTDTLTKTTKKPNQLEREVNRRRTFAIISHPDAGKTTLTEKFLLYGGAIHEAGSIKSRKARKYAASDWMTIEQERGISVTSSVMRFEYRDIKYNLLDTPGHKDFSEDTLRTLIAADNALMVIDVAKGVEEQTEKLFEVCKMRHIPIITFVNKCDRVGLEPLEVLSDIESNLGIQAVPATWPMGRGKHFQGIYVVSEDAVHLYDKAEHGTQKAATEIVSLEEAVAQSTIPASELEQFEEEVLLIQDELEQIEKDAFLNGEVTPVFFGSALNNFGVDLFLDHFSGWAQSPQPYKTADDNIRDLDRSFSGFIFKLQANMNPDHRDCAAFVRVTSGKFERGKEVTHDRTGKTVRLSTPHTLMGDERDILEEAYPGDVIALFNPGEFQIGDALYTNDPAEFNVIPLFSPEHFLRVSTKEPFKRKQLREGLKQLSEEGVVHVFEVPDGVGNELLLGTVGVLQFDVVKHRMKTEYNTELNTTAVPYTFARWLPSDEKVIGDLKSSYFTHVTKDMEGNPIVLFESRYALEKAEDKVGAENLYKYKQH
ncbi:MAG: peptide chain release factor 3 [Candidatus Marinimicrobia bacterium]|nr:peptide chain release factor 3 [Candidatus Neomarinimicrobiota bacterium]MCF7828532.1 peptide chain release factor 3 [Candidatus Neomarinimicrobiota bacterium]MCF7882045.1 peptide chain release factor 3 [Candidatus Neomarinimicrobiota bacterium]